MPRDQFLDWAPQNSDLKAQLTHPYWICHMNMWINESYHVVNAHSYPSFRTMASKSVKCVTKPYKLDILHMLNPISDSWGSLKESNSGTYVI